MILAVVRTVLGLGMNFGLGEDKDLEPPGRALVAGCSSFEDSAGSNLVGPDCRGLGSHHRRVAEGEEEPRMRAALHTCLPLWM